MDTILSSRPSSYAKLFHLSLVLYRRSFAHVFILAVLLGIVVFIPRFISIRTGADIIFDQRLLSPMRLWILLIDLVVVGLLVAMYWRIYCVIRHKQEPLIEDLNVGIHKTLLVFLTSIVQAFILFGLAMLCFSITLLLFRHGTFFFQTQWGIICSALIFAGQVALILYVFTTFIFFIPIIALESKGIFTSLIKSFSLVWNHWWRVFSLQITPWLCYLIVLMILKYVMNLNVHIYLVYDQPHSLMSSILQCIVFIFFVPWVACTLIVQLKDLELRQKTAVKKKRNR